MEEHRGGFAEQMSIIFIGVTSRTVLILVEYLPALSPVAIARLISLQRKVLIQGGEVLCFHALLRMYIA